MPDYAAMYARLFQSQTKAIQLLQEAQQDTEEIYLTAPEPNITVLRPIAPDDTPDEEK
jgi:hypothetical protein